MIGVNVLPIIPLRVLHALVIAVSLLLALSVTATAQPSPPQGVLECEQICLHGITWE